MTTTKWLKANLSAALGAEPLQLHALVARMVVLYEDLRLEVEGIVAEELKGTNSEGASKGLDAIGSEARRQYFMRRAIATTVEFAEAFRLLDECDQFKSVKDRLSSPDLVKWNDTVAFLKEHEPLLEKVRNDIGGHFGYQACGFRKF